MSNLSPDFVEIPLTNEPSIASTTSKESNIGKTNWTKAPLGFLGRTLSFLTKKGKEPSSPADTIRATYSRLSTELPAASSKMDEIIKLAAKGKGLEDDEPFDELDKEEDETASISSLSESNHSSSRSSQTGRSSSVTPPDDDGGEEASWL